MIVLQTMFKYERDVNPKNIIWNEFWRNMVPHGSLNIIIAINNLIFRIVKNLTCEITETPPPEREYFLVVRVKN